MAVQSAGLTLPSRLQSLDPAERTYSFNEHHRRRLKRTIIGASRAGGYVLNAQTSLCAQIARYHVGKGDSSSSARVRVEEQESHTCSSSGSKRRSMMAAACVTALSSVIFSVGNALAVKQVLLAGRVPGLSPPDENGLRTYRRPEAKSGGHGVGWSPIIPYSFKVPDEWEEVPVSIADLGGTEIDLRFSSKQEGNLSVVVAPVLRFASDLGENATMEKVGPPDKVIDAFGPELVGQNVEGQVRDMEVTQHDGRTYYFYELEVPHVLITATAAGNRLYLMTVSGNARQWKKYGEGLKQIAESFRVG